MDLWLRSLVARLPLIVSANRLMLEIEGRGKRREVESTLPSVPERSQLKPSKPFEHSVAPRQFIALKLLTTLDATYLLSYNEPVLNS
jgi:hypothetical protein